MSVVQFLALEYSLPDLCIPFVPCMDVLRPCYVATANGADYGHNYVIVNLCTYMQVVNGIIALGRKVLHASIHTITIVTFSETCLIQTTLTESVKTTLPCPRLPIFHP